MSRYAVENIICPDGHRDRRMVCVSGDEDLPTCDVLTPGPVVHTLAQDDEVRRGRLLCGKPTMIVEDTEFNGTEHVQVFKPFTYEGVHYADQAQWDRNKAEIAKSMAIPVTDLVELPPDRARDKVRADEAAHRGYLNRKQSGHGEAGYAEYVKDQRRKTGKDTSIVVGWRGTR